MNTDKMPVPNSTAKSTSHRTTNSGTTFDDLATQRKNTNYWFQNMAELTSLDNMDQLLPARGMTYPQKVNALVRLSWFIGILASLINWNLLYLYIPIVAMLITYGLYLFRAEQYKRQSLAQQTETALAKNQKGGMLPPDAKLIEKFSDFLDTRANLTRPSDTNPFMNPLPFDNRNRGPAVPLLSNPVNRATVDIAFDKGNWRDVNDVWDRNNGKRQFFTMPWTTYPNDQGSFANWLYKTPPTCKEGNGNQCVANTFDIQTSNRVAGGVVSGVFN
jgi:hypothetical protein